MTKILLVGEAFGAKEDMFQHGFVGSSGAELARMLSEAGITDPVPSYPSELDMIAYWKREREENEITIANVFAARPENNQIELFFTNAKEGLKTVPPLKAGKFLRPDLLWHLERLWQLIEELKPNLILALGNTACWAVLGESKISALRGTIKMSPRLGIKVLPTYHPAAILRDWKLRPIALADFTKARNEAQSSTITRVERWMTIEPTLAEIAEWFDRPATYYAVDIETYGKQISMIGFARSSFDALVIPFMDETRPGWSFWSSVQEEIQAWRFCQKGLASSIPKIFQNGVFDLSYLLRVGFRPASCTGDTMLLHHSLYPELLKGLGFLGSIYANEQAWKTMSGRGNNLKRDQ